MFGMNCRECGRRPGGAYLTAYQIALKYGFVGTEAQWIRSIGTMRSIHVTERSGGTFECDASLGQVLQMMEDGFIPVLITVEGLPAFLSDVTDEMLSFSTMLIQDLEGDYYDCYSMSGREYTVERVTVSGSEGGGGSIGPNSITYNMLAQNVRNALDNAAEASQKLENGITEDDLASDVKAILDAVAGKYVKPGTGIPLGDLSAEVRSLIGQGGYVKPAGGIPKADLDDMVNAALTKAENAVLRSGLLAKPNEGSFGRAYIDQSGNVWCQKAEAVTVTLSVHPETTAAMLSSRTVSELYADTQMGRIIYIRDVSGRVGTLVDPPDSPYDTAVYAVIDLDHNQVLMYVQSGNTVTMTPVSYDARGVYRIPETGIPEQHLDAAVRAKLNASGGGGGVAPLVGVTDAESEGYASPVVVKGALDIGRPVSLAHNDGTTDYLFTAFGATGSVVNGVIAGENLTFYILTGTVSGWTFATVQAASAAALTALSAQVAPPVVGTTENKTPQQIAEAIVAGKSVYLTHTVDGSTYGFHAWYKTPAAVIGVGSVGYSGGVNHVTLTGSLLNGQWAMGSTRTPAAPLVVTVVEDQQAANGYSADHTAAEVFNAMRGGLSVELVFEKDYDSFEGSLVEYNDTTAIFSLLDTTISNFPSLRVFVLEDDYITCTEIPIRELTPGNVGMGFFTCWGTGEDDPCDIPDEHFMPLAGAPFFVHFNSALAANAEMTVDDGARKPLYYRGAPITANTIQAGDIATVVVNSGKYVIVGIDRDEAGSGTADVTAAAVATAISGMNTSQKNASRQALNAEIAGAAAAVQGNLDAVTALLPPNASSSNKLATAGDIPVTPTRDSSTDTVKVKQDPTTKELYVPTYPSGGAIAPADIVNATGQMNATQKTNTRQNIGAEQSGAAAAVQTNLDAVTAKIPSNASSSNKLATQSDLPVFSERGSGDTVEVKQDMTTRKLYVPAGSSGGVGKTVVTISGSTCDTSLADIIAAYQNGNVIECWAEGLQCWLGYPPDSFGAQFFGIDSDSGNILYGYHVGANGTVTVFSAHIGNADKPEQIPLEGTTPTIAFAGDNAIYTGGTLTSLTVTQFGNSGMFMLIFDSGSSPTSLNLPAYDSEHPTNNYVKWGDFTVEANKHYEVSINIINGVGYLVGKGW